MLVKCQLARVNWNAKGNGTPAILGCQIRDGFEGGFFSTLQYETQSRLRLASHSVNRRRLTEVLIAH